MCMHRLLCLCSLKTQVIWLSFFSGSLEQEKRQIGRRFKKVLGTATFILQYPTGYRSLPKKTEGRKL